MLRLTLSVQSDQLLSIMPGIADPRWDALYGTARLKDQYSHASPDGFGRRDDSIAPFPNDSRANDAANQLIMSTRFFTNHGERTLFKKFQGVFESNPDIECFDALVGYLRSSGYLEAWQVCWIKNNRVSGGVNVRGGVERTRGTRQSSLNRGGFFIARLAFPISL